MPLQQIIGVDHVRFWVANAAVFAARVLCDQFGFAPVGVERNATRIVHYVKQQSCLIAVESSTHYQDDEFHRFIRKHGDAVRDVAFLVNDAHAALAQFVSAGARIACDIQERDGIVLCTVDTPFGDVQHTLVQRCDGSAAGSVFRWLQPSPLTVRKMITANRAQVSNIDHVTVVVQKGTLYSSYRWYQTVGCERLRIDQDEDEQEGLLVDTGRSAMRSMIALAGTLPIVLAEPADSHTLSQVQEFLDHNHGPGIQHVAFATHDIISTVSVLRDNGVAFISVPAAYYDIVRADACTVPALLSSMEQLCTLNILIDTHAVFPDIHASQTYLLQTFTLPLHDRATFFVELIQRTGGAGGFGRANMHALFKAVEAAQDYS